MVSSAEGHGKAITNYSSTWRKRTDKSCVATFSHDEHYDLKM
jgi:hypothetical protein